MHARAVIWRGIGGGLLLPLQAYRTYILPLAGVVAQLRDLPQSWPSHERRLTAALCPGARGWATPCLLQQLKSLGFANSPMQRPWRRALNVEYSGGRPWSRGVYASGLGIALSSLLGHPRSISIGRRAGRPGLTTT